MKKTIYMMILSLFGVLASCSKNDGKDEPETPAVKISQSVLMGKWELSNLDWIYYTSTGQEDYRSSYTNKNADDPRRTWITFENNKSYFHAGGSVGTMLADIMPATGGKWALTSENKVIILNEKEWTTTKFENNQMQIEYNETGSNGTKSKIILLFIKN